MTFHNLRLLPDTNSSGRRLIHSPTAYTVLSNTLWVGGNTDDPACHWLYNMLFPADPDLRLAMLVLLPLPCYLRLTMLALLPPSHALVAFSFSLFFFRFAKMGTIAS
jgi:hypothetical protein